jgi:hypothetical protein
MSAPQPTHVEIPATGRTSSKDHSAVRRGTRNRVPHQPSWRDGWWRRKQQGIRADDRSHVRAGMADAHPWIDRTPSRGTLRAGMVRAGREARGAVRDLRPWAGEDLSAPGHSRPASGLLGATPARPQPGAPTPSDGISRRADDGHDSRRRRRDVVHPNSSTRRPGRRGA